MKIKPVEDCWISDQARETYEAIMRQCEIEIRHITGIDDWQFGINDLNDTQILQRINRATHAEVAAQALEIQRLYVRIAAQIYRDFTVPVAPVFEVDRET